jgi:hypothetical protein
MKILLGAVISLPPVSAGCAWNRLQYVLGLRRLGHDVCLIEEVRPEWCADAAGRPCAYDASVNRRAFRDILESFGLLGQSCQLFDGGRAATGLSRDEVRQAAREADVMINISGHVTSELVLDEVRSLAYLDQDPVYTQLWQAEYGRDLGLSRYDVCFTVGLNIGTPHSPIPDCGIRWQTTLPPVVPDLWEHEGNWSDPPACRFTTVASWGGYGDLQFRGEWYRSKYDEVRRFAGLPSRAGPRFEFELLLKNFAEGDEGVRLLRESGWRVRRSGAEATDLWAYRDYVGGSSAEIGITKGAYVKGRSGWFSDRTASYLASGRPALAQSTGFERHIPTGAGLLCFEDVDEAAAGAEVIAGNYHRHCRAARELAAEYLDYRKVLPAMLDACTAAPAAAATGCPAGAREI